VEFLKREGATVDRTTEVLRRSHLRLRHRKGSISHIARLEALEMKLFGYLPKSLFQPLVGTKKHVYARLLMRLYERVYSARILETPLREEVVKRIEIGLSEVGIGSSAFTDLRRLPPLGARK
jgi:hypothetical protein